MTPLDDYLDRVRHAMAGMEPSVRDDIVRELRSHLTESTAANGGNPGMAVAALGSPAEVGRNYRKLYGYGRAYRLMFAGIAFLVAIFSVPVLAAGDPGVFPYGLSILFLVAAAAWVVWVSAAAGRRAGTMAGTGAFVGRILAFGVAAGSQRGAVASPGGVALFGIASAMLILLGWLPGTAKQVWSGPRAEL
jgi:uncharacterized membrane protein